MNLKPCPFCGASEENMAVWAGDPLDGIPGMIYQISCYRCGCDGPPSSSKRSAVTIWNARPSVDGTPPKYMQLLNAEKAAFDASQK